MLCFCQPPRLFQPPHLLTLEIFANLTVCCTLTVYYFGLNLPASPFIANTYIAQYLLTRSKGNQTMKIGQLIEYNIFFFKNHAENGLGRLVPDLILVFKKGLYEVKLSMGKSKWSAA